MGLRITDTYATVWETRPGKGNYTEGRISINRKVKETDSFETDFSGFVRFCGNANAKSSSLTPKSRIKITSGEVTNSYNKEKKTEYWNVAVFDFETTTPLKTPKVDDTPTKEPGDPDYMPF